MKKIFVMFAIGLLVLATSCDTKNIGIDLIGRGPVPVLTAPTTGLEGMGTSTFTVNWAGGTAPYTVAWNFGGGAANVGAAAGVSPVSQNVTWNDLAAAADFVVTVTVTDALDQFNVASATVHVIETQNMAPFIDSMVVAGNVLTVTASDPDGDALTVDIAGYTGMTADATSVAGDVAAFAFTADDMLVGANSTVDVSVTDGAATTTGTSAAVVIAAFAPAADTLYAIPMAATAAVDEPVTILVYTGATGAFQFMLNVGLVVPADASYESNTFNVGAIGGNTDDADGVWAAITSNGGFILGPDMLIQPGANPEDSLGTDNRFDFNISPLGGTDQASVSGALFNAQFSFSAAGTKTITFQEFNGVNRTYYSDLAASTDTFWGAFVDGTIDVS